MKKALSVLLFAALASPVLAQAPTSTPPGASDRAQSYFFFARGRILEEQGQWNQAIEEYKKASEVDPNNSLIFSEIADTYWRHNRVRDAVEFAEKAVQIDSNNIEAHKLLGSVYINMVGAANSPQAATEAIQRAVREFEEIVRIDPGERQAFLMLGRLYQVQNQPAKAEEIYKKFLGVEPGSEDGVLALADLHLNANNAESAVGLLEDFLKNQPESDRAWQSLGQALTALGRFNRAAEAYAKAVELNPEDADLLRDYSQALFFDNQVEEAAKAYERLLQQDPNDTATLLRLGQIYRNLMRYDASRTHLEKAVQLNANNIETQFEMALLDREDGQLEPASTRLESILKTTQRTDGQYAEAELRNRRVFTTYLGLTYSSLGRYDDAVRAFTELRGISPDKERVDAYIIDVYRSAKSVDKAIEYAQTAMRESPNSPELRMIYAEALADKGRTDDAIRTLDQIPDNSDTAFEVISTKASVYQRAKRFDDAQKAIDEGVRRFPEDERVYFIQGALYEKQDKVAEAERAFRRSIELEADNAAALNYLGYMLADRNMKLEEALSLIQKAVELDRAQGAYLDSLGWVYFRLNQLDLAEQYLKKAVLFSRTDSDVHDHLGELYLKMGRYEEARTAWTKSLEFAEDQEEAQKYRKKLDDLRNKIVQR